MEYKDRQIVERVSSIALDAPDVMQSLTCARQLFLEQHLQVVCATSCLAQGVNLPAHLVVGKVCTSFLLYSPALALTRAQSTQFYQPGSGYVELSDLSMLQMIGRAGRPQFDDSGIAVIMTSADQRDKWTRLLDGREIIESTYVAPALFCCLYFTR